MNMIVLVTAASAPLAMPGLSAPVAPQGNLIFVAHSSITGGPGAQAAIEARRDQFYRHCRG